MVDGSFTKSIEDLSVELGTKLDVGLSDEQVATHRTKWGENKLASVKNKPWWKIFLEQYKDVLMLVLLASSIISLIVAIFPTDGKSWGAELKTINGWENFILIVAVTILNAILGTVQTIKSQKSLESLKKLSAPKAKVLRNNTIVQIESSNVVVGDILIFEAGDMIAADARLIEVHALKVDESSLTGESKTVLKNTKIISNPKTPLGDRLNCVFSGCLVTYGRAKAIVTAVGQNSEMGKINKLLIETSETKTPLQVNLNKLAKFLMWAVLIICSVLFVINISKIAFTDKSTSQILGCFSSSLNFSIALAVAVIPEALSSMITIVLSISTKRMTKQNAIVKDLKSVEGLGSVSVICSDKTGTITQNKMTVKGFFINGKNHTENEADIKNKDQVNLFKYAVLSSDAKIKNGSVIGDPTEACLVEYYQSLNFNTEELEKQNPRISELAFDSERMMMSTLVKMNNKEKVMLTKGALDKLLVKCTSILDNGQIRKITPTDIKKIKESNDYFSNQGKRVLCFVCKKFNKDKLSFDDEKDFTFVGLISMVDPPRVEVIEAIKECHTAGIKVVMITGDHQSTAVAISKEIGIFKDNDWSMNGMELASINESELTKNIARYAVYARVSPQDKIKIVKAWQSHNMIVSMTGDGVNDAPALKQADVGVAMGITGTEVSKDAASIILSDDNFSTIVKAIKYGRSVYNNIKNSIRFLLVGNLAIVFVALIITIFSLIIQVTVSPFSAIQLLFLNMITDSWLAISLGLERYKNDVIYEKPRLANEFFINKKFLLKVLCESLVLASIVLITFFITFYTIQIDTSEYVDSPAELLTNLRFESASACAFMTLAFCRFFHGFNCKSENPILFSKTLFDNYCLIGSFIFGVVSVAILYYTPVGRDLFLDIHKGTNIGGDVYNGVELGNYNNTLIWLSFAASSSTLFIIQTYRYIVHLHASRKMNINAVKLNNY